MASCLFQKKNFLFNSGDKKKTAGKFFITDTKADVDVMFSFLGRVLLLYADDENRKTKRKKKEKTFLLFWCRAKNKYVIFICIERDLL